MWSSFAIASLSYLVLFVPSGLLLFGLGFDVIWSIALSPLASIGVYAILGQAYALAGVSSSVPLLVIPPLVLACAAFFLLRHRGRTLSIPHLDWKTFLLYLGMGLFLGLWVYVRDLPAPDALFQAWDTPQHVSVIRAFADSGHFSSLDVSLYLTQADKAIDPVPASGFYPAAWHVLCAMVVQLTSCEVTIAINASEFVMVSLAYPLGWAVLMSLMFPGDRTKVRLGALVCMAFTSFPWQLMMFGPVYPNLVGFCVLPAAMGLFMLAFGPTTNLRTTVICVVTLLASMLGLVLLHPNVIFTALVLLMFWCARRVHDCLAEALSGRGTFLSRVVPWLGWLAFMLFCLAFWNFCFNLPALHDIVTHYWKTYAKPNVMLRNILQLTYTNKFCYNMAPQYLLGALVIVGAVGACRSGRTRWMTLSYLVAAFILFWVATYEGEPGNSRYFLGGFWYTDPMRLASMLVFASIPCATLGLGLVVGWVQRLVFHLRGDDDPAAAEKNASAAGRAGLVITVAVAVVFCAVNYFPGVYRTRDEVAANPKAGNAIVRSPFGDMCYIVNDIYSGAAPLSPAEHDFLARVKKVVGNDLVINNPVDGSLFAYGTSGIRTYYRTYTGVGGTNETDASRQIRIWLNRVGESETVRDAVRQTGAKYVLILDDSDSFYSFLNLKDTLAESKSDFYGLRQINDDTPGLTPVLSDGGRLRLYRIDY